MGLTLDTSVLIASERRGWTANDILRQVRSEYGELDIALSAISVLELTHGIYRARNETQSLQRKVFVDAIIRAVLVIPVSLEIAALAGRIEGQQAAVGNVIAVEDLVIGATALHLGHSVVTLNVRHFQRIPGLQIFDFST